jgi:hypothetical protein
VGLLTLRVPESIGSQMLIDDWSAPPTAGLIFNQQSAINNQQSSLSACAYPLLATASTTE